MARRHVITGGLGFTARYLVDELGRFGEEIVLADIALPGPEDGRLAARVVRCDVRSDADIERLDLQPNDIVYHLAARQFASGVPAQRKDRERWFAEVNVDGTRNIVEWMCRQGARQLIFFSTDMTYGRPRSLPVQPDHPQHPLGPYGQSKLLAESVIAEGRARGMSATVFRPRLIAGAGRLGILTRLFYLIQKGLPVPMIGSGKNRYQMASVRDCARAAVRAMQIGCPSGCFNLGSENPPSSRDLLSALIAHAGSRSMLVSTPAPVVKGVLDRLDAIGLPIMYPEQFLIADLDILLDTSLTQSTLDWRPSETDQDIMIAAYDRFCWQRQGANA